ncbi:hypothetical protein IIB34_05565 [PVC group bacterium]|nr:hypothetical protein [PVC group bacterium]
MPETRTIETYEQGTGKLIKTETYQVSDEELAEEVKSQRMANILDELDGLRATLTDHEERLSRDISGHSR